MDQGKAEWLKHFDERQQKEIDFARLYASDFRHGTDGHNAKLIIAQMAEILTNQEQALTLCQQEIARLDQELAKKGP